MSHGKPDDSGAFLLLNQHLGYWELALLAATLLDDVKLVISCNLFTVLLFPALQWP